MSRGFPLQDEGPGMAELFHDLSVEQAEEADAEYNARFEKLCAMTPELEAQGWRSLDSAPHDGTEVEIRVVHYLAPVHGDEKDNRYIDACRAHWIDHNGGGFTWYGLAGSPCQWRPLSANPR